MTVLFDDVAASLKRGVPCRFRPLNTHSSADKLLFFTDGNVFFFFVLLDTGEQAEGSSLQSN